jgi:hypothetical protein
MNSDDEMYSIENSDSAEEENDDDEDDDYVMSLDQEPAGAAMKSPRNEEENSEEDFPFDVLTTDQIVQHMADSIKEVNTVVQVDFCCYSGWGDNVFRSLFFISIFFTDFQFDFDNPSSHKSDRYPNSVTHYLQNRLHSTLFALTE